MLEELKVLGDTLVTITNYGKAAQEIYKGATFVKEKALTSTSKEERANAEENLAEELSKCIANAEAKGGIPTVNILDLIN